MSAGSADLSIDGRLTVGAVVRWPQRADRSASLGPARCLGGEPARCADRGTEAAQLDAERAVLSVVCAMIGWSLGAGEPSANASGTFDAGGSVMSE